MPATAILNSSSSLDMPKNGLGSSIQELINAALLTSMLSRSFVGEKNESVTPNGPHLILCAEYPIPAKSLRVSTKTESQTIRQHASSLSESICWHSSLYPRLTAIQRSMCSSCSVLVIVFSPLWPASTQAPHATSRRTGYEQSCIYQENCGARSRTP